VSQTCTTLGSCLQHTDEEEEDAHEESDDDGDDVTESMSQMVWRIHNCIGDFFPNKNSDHFLQFEKLLTGGPHSTQDGTLLAACAGFYLVDLAQPDTIISASAIFPGQRRA
jgi:hypothetical protein